MNNTYIKNKLDAFKEYLFLVENSEEEFSNEILINKFKEIITDSYNQCKTDYHNHIVEKMKNYNADGFNGNDQSMIIKVDLIEYLQDTNPKE